MIKIFSCYNRSDLLEGIEKKVFEFIKSERKNKHFIQKPEIISMFVNVSEGYYFLTIHYKIISK